MIDNNFNKSQYQQFGNVYLEEHAKKDGVGGGKPHDRVELLKKYLPLGSTVFEIGSAGGDDATALQDAGYTVIASDFVKLFVDKLKKRGLHTIEFDAKNHELPQNVDAIYANAVFVHFTPEEVGDFLRKAKTHLQNEKIVFMSVIKGEGSERATRTTGFARDFHYHTLQALTKLLEKEGYKILYGSDADPKWIQIICQSK